jgi:hypothetical protein
MIETREVPMLILSFAFLLLAGGAWWLTGVHPARNVLRLRRTLVSFFLILGLLSFGLQLSMQAVPSAQSYSLSAER